MIGLTFPVAPAPEYLLEDYEPACLQAYRKDELAERVLLALKELEDCCVCPRNCHVNRLLDEKRVCNTGRYAIVSSAFPHFGEEDCLRGRNGSGTIFFGLCNLRCVFCQNWDISQQHQGRECNANEIADLMLMLQDKGCHNINFVTPEHVAPQVIEAIAAVVPRGLRVPIVYNTSSYDSMVSLKLLDGLVDIYMPDFKFWHRESARYYAKAKDYPEKAREAIREMHRQVGVLKFGPDGLAKRGVLVRHLVMPGQSDEATEIFRWLADEISPDTYINVMGQYRPEHYVGPADKKGKYAAINRTPYSSEMQAARDAALNAGLTRLDQRIGRTIPINAV